MFHLEFSFDRIDDCHVTAENPGNSNARLGTLERCAVIRTSGYPFAPITTIRSAKSPLRSRTCIVHADRNEHGVGGGGIGVNVEGGGIGANVGGGCISMRVVTATGASPNAAKPSPTATSRIVQPTPSGSVSTRPI